MNENIQYDVVVIGGGTAGSNAARAARRAGAERVALIHLPDFFNTCIEEGCMPSKSLITSAERGLSFTDATKLMEQHIDRLREGSHKGLEAEDFEIILGKAHFVEGGSLVVEGADGEHHLSGARYVLATGSESFVPPITGLDTLPEDAHFTSSGLVSKRHITTLPKSVFILGGGPIGLEMMTALSHFGVDVTVAERAEGLLGRMDPEFGKELERAIEQNPHTKVLTGANLSAVAYEGNEVVCTVDRGGKEETYRAEKILLAVGRKPCFESLHLEHAGIKLDEKGHLPYDEATLQTENLNIYVAGDMTGRYQILHFAAAMGRVAGENAAKGAPGAKMDYAKNNMGVIFSEPQIGNVGMTETEAGKAGVETISVTLDLPNIGRGLLEDRKVGLWKVTAQKSDGRILGAQAISAMPHSEWFVDVIAWIMHFNGTVDDLVEKVPYYHPTYPELLQSLGRMLKEKM